MLTLKQIDQRLKTLRTSGYNTVNQTVQEVAVSIINHANDYGDASRAPKLARCVPLQMRPLLVAFFENCSPINVTMGKTVKDDKVSLRKEPSTDSGKTSKYHPFDIEKAKANNWWENPFKVETEEKPLLTLGDYYTKFENAFKRMVNETKVDTEKVNPDDRENIQALEMHLRNALKQFRSQKAAGQFDTLADDETENPAEQMVKAAA
jgi:hypothetical protein